MKVFRGVLTAGLRAAHSYAGVGGMRVGAVVQTRVEHANSECLRRSPPRPIAVKSKEKMFHFLCAPDTIDPRGPKGGGR